MDNEQKTLFFVDSEGSYIGGFCGVEPPEGSREVPFAPEHAAQKWDFKNESWGKIPDEAINEVAIMKRSQAYRDEADPLFFKWQRGEGTKQEWLDKVDEIKKRIIKE